MAKKKQDDWVNIQKDPAHINKERQKAKSLRKTTWWQQQVQKGICHYCGKKFDSKDLTLDHIVPISRGGKSTKGNCVPACLKCNQEKKYFTPVDLIIKKLNKEKESS